MVCLFEAAANPRRTADDAPDGAHVARHFYFSRKVPIVIEFVRSRRLQARIKSADVKAGLRKSGFWLYVGLTRKRFQVGFVKIATAYVGNRADEGQRARSISLENVRRLKVRAMPDWPMVFLLAPFSSILNLSLA